MQQLLQQNQQQQRAAMDLFPDGEHVRLQSRDRRGMYLHAAEDGVGVYLSPRRPSHNQSWQVLRVERGGNTYVLLHNSAYGRYLKATHDAGPRGHIGQRVVQGAYDEQEDEAALSWVPVKAATGDDNVLLQHVSNRLLRANGKYLRWRTGVTVDDYLNVDTMTHWVVEAIPPRGSAAHLAVRPKDGGLFCGTPVVERTIRFVRAENDGSFDPNGWREIQYQGRCTFGLRREVAKHVSENITNGIVLSIRAGNLGPLIPLVADLPQNEDPMEVIVLNIWTPPSDFRYPAVELI